MPRGTTHTTALLAAALAATMLSPAGAAPHRRGHHHSHHAARHHRPAVARQPYASGYDSSTTCRTANGTPYDPDIIGGVNHVGDGGPAANYGTGLGNPCSSLYLGGPGLVGPR